MDPLACDTFRASRSFRRFDTFKVLRHSRTFRPIATMRWYQSSSGLKRKMIKRLHMSACNRAGMDLPPDTSIGAGIAIFHGWGVVVSAGAKIGCNVTLMQGITIGQADRILPDGTRSTGFPTVEDNVWIGPHAVIVGGITVGKGSRILAGAVVNADVPPGSLVAGNPSKIIRGDVVEDVINKVPFSQILTRQISKSRS